MPDVVRVGVTPRYAVTHELTPEGDLLIVEDQVVTVEEGQETDVPLGEVVPADPVTTDEPPPPPPPPAARTTSPYSSPSPAPAPAPAPVSEV